MSGRRAFRLIDSGVDDGRRQIAYDAALTELHAAGRVPDTVRFMRFPPTVLVGRHQVLAHEVDVERCRAEGVRLVRRVTGGGAIYLDEGQVGWELVLGRRTLPLATLADYARAISEAVARGLAGAFGVPARFRPRNDIEVDGRKIGGTGGYFAGETLVYQGTVLVDMDAARMARLLNIPEAKLARHGSANAESRVVTLKELLGSAPPIQTVQHAVLAGLSSELGIDTVAAEPCEEERALTARLHDTEMGTDGFVFGDLQLSSSTSSAAGEPVLEARRQCVGGMVVAYLRLEGAGAARRVREVSITGDFFIAPPRALYDLEAALRGVPVAEVGAAIDAYFSASVIGMISLTPADFRAVVIEAIDKDPAKPVTAKKPRKKLVVILVNTDPRNGEELGAPFYHAAVAAAMDYDVDVICTATAGRLMRKGVAESLVVKPGSAKTVYDFIKDAHHAGVRFLCCSANLDLFEMSTDDLIPECTGVVGAATFMSEIMEDDVKVITY